MDADNALRQRRETVTALRRLLGEQQTILNRLHRESAKGNASAAPGSARPFKGMLGSLGALDRTVAKAEPALLWPVTTRNNARRQSLWHEYAFAIAMLAIEALRDTQPVSINRHGPLVRFVAKALERATGRTFSESTVATALRQTPLANRRFNLPNIKPVP
jgi:hypothetical protein